MPKLKPLRKQGFLVAVAAGFEPAVAINHTAFRVLHLRPLGHATANNGTGQLAAAPIVSEAR